MKCDHGKYALILLLGLPIGAVGAVAKAPPASAPAPAAEAPEYVYAPVLRDPFVPLAGASTERPAAAATPAGDKTGPFNPVTVQLKGILRTPTGRWAVLTATTGERFVVKNGKVFDAKRKTVEGFVAIIKEKSLVVIDANNQVTELKLKRDKEESTEKHR